MLVQPRWKGHGIMSEDTHMEVDEEGCELEVLFGRS